MKNSGLMLWPVNRRPAIEPSVASCIAGHKRDTPLSGGRPPGGCRGCIITPLARDDIGSSAHTKHWGRGDTGRTCGRVNKGHGRPGSHTGPRSDEQSEQARKADSLERRSDGQCDVRKHICERNWRGRIPAGSGCKGYVPGEERGEGHDHARVGGRRGAR